MGPPLNASGQIDSTPTLSSKFQRKANFRQPTMPVASPEKLSGGPTAASEVPARTGAPLVKESASSVSRSDAATDLTSKDSTPPLLSPGSLSVSGKKDAPLATVHAGAVEPVTSTWVSTEDDNAILEDRDISSKAVPGDDSDIASSSASSPRALSLQTLPKSEPESKTPLAATPHPVPKSPPREVSPISESPSVSLEDLDHAKNLVLDLLGWGVQPEFLVESGVSAHAIFRIFTDLNLRLPTNLVISDTTKARAYAWGPRPPESGDVHWKP